MALALTACGSGGGGSGGSGGGGTASLATGNLALVGHSPSAHAVQVAVDATIELRFDGSIAVESLQEPETRLVADGSTTAIPLTFTLGNGGRTVLATPTTPLAAETDYTLTLSPLTSDTTGRILELETSIPFRTFDARPPTVASASVGAGATGVDRRAPLTLTFDEPIDPASLVATSITLFDAYGTRCPITLAAQGAQVLVTPVADLVGSRSHVLSVPSGGVRDRAGNAIAATFSRTFTTAVDVTPPGIASIWPSGTNGITPRIQPTITFDEAIDEASVEPGALTLTDEYGSQVGYTVHASADMRTLRIAPKNPLHAGRSYDLILAGGPGAITDRSGNALPNAHVVSFATGEDDAPPVLTSTLPTAAATRVSLNVTPKLVFDDVLDAARVSPSTVTLTAAGTPVAIAVTVMLQTGIQITPATSLPPGAECVVRVRGGHDGLRDRAGNPLAADVTLTFRTADDPTLPALLVLPMQSSVSVPAGAKLVVLADQPLDPETVHAGVVRVTSGGFDVPGTLALSRSNRLITFTPTSSMATGVWYRIRIESGVGGLREASGNWLLDPIVSEFRIGYATDLIAPSVRVTLNGIDAARNTSLTVPPSGFTIEVSAEDPVHYSLDMTSTEIELDATGSVPGAEAIFATANIDTTSCRWTVPADRPLPTGTYTVTARVRDLSGNVGTSAPLTFRVATADDPTVPFERTQVVWTRFDMDRDGNGRTDFEDDLLRLGLIAEGDPAGTNARMIAIVRDGMLASTNRLFHRGPTGAVLGTDSVAVRLTHRRPLGVAHMQIAVGGLDPEGARGREYGADTTGTLGRAFYDYRNAAPAELNIATRPGLGVFPSEMFLYQTKIHLQVYPSFLTVFARRFLNLSPAMGGTAAGAHALDPIVLAPGFDYAMATTEQRARFNVVFTGADDWATAIGVILAHEIGHSVGLVAPGPNPGGLHGDASLHNEFAETTDVMAPAVGYESLVGLDYAFRDLTIAYLRHRILLR